VLVEGGAHLLSDFVAERRLDELFLTLSPQIAGREAGLFRPSLVEGKRFAPANPVWTTLVSLKRNQDHLFLRYRL
jgi:riboflavin biosynthesis pyrimidine reductase